MSKATVDFRSTGQMCADFQTSHARIVKAIETLGLVAKMRMNGCPYYDDEQQDAIREELNQAKPKRGGRSVAMA